MRADWRSRAACANMADPTFAESDPFFPEGMRGAGYGAKRYATAKAICSTCHVQIECLTVALEAEAQIAPYRWGVWAGLNANERQELSRRSA